jgi:phytoene synthase
MTELQERLLQPGEFSTDEAYDLCQLYTKERAKNFYYAFSILPSLKRRAILAAYSFAGEADDISDGDGSDQGKLQALKALHADLQAAAAGTPSGPLWVALADATRYQIPLDYFDELVRGCEMDLVINRYETFEDLRVYCYHVASLVGLICVSVFGTPDGEAAGEHAIDLGIAMQLTNIMRDVREDAQRGRIYLPLEDLRRFGISEEEVLQGVYSDRFRALMEFQAARAEEFFARGSRLLGLLDLRSRMCVNVLRGVYAELLERMADCEYDVFSRRVRLSGGEKVALIGRLWVEGVVGASRRA